MPRVTAACLMAALLAAWPAPALFAEPPLCKVGSSVVELVHLHSTWPDDRIDPTLVGSSLIFLLECPASVVPAFRAAEKAGFDPELRRKWVAAVRSAARDSSNIVVRGLLALATEKVARLGDRALNEFLDGIAGLADSLRLEHRSLESLLERQALATLKQNSECDGAGCFNTSDDVLFLLGTHPVPVLKAMHADSVSAAQWLSSVADESFAGAPEAREGAEAARRAVLKKLSETRAPGFEREQRACEKTLSKIRYRTVALAYRRLGNHGA